MSTYISCIVLEPKVTLDDDNDSDDNDNDENDDAAADDNEEQFLWYDQAFLDDVVQ